MPNIMNKSRDSATAGTRPTHERINSCAASRKLLAGTRF